MSSSSSSSSPSIKSLVIEELVRAREFAYQFRRMRLNSTEADRSVSDESTLVESVLRSYTQALSLLNSIAPTSSNYDIWSEDSGKKRKISSPIANELRNDESLSKRTEIEMQNEAHDSLSKQLRGKKKISDTTCLWHILTDSSDEDTSRTSSSSQDYSGPS